MKPEDERERMGLRILVVDDEKDIVEYLTAVLEDAGYRVLGLNKAEGALEVMRETKPDMVLLDIMMPGRTGLSLYRSIRHDPATAGIPVVIISGYAKQEEFRLMDLAGPDSEELPAPEGYLEKPISVPGLLQSLEEILERSTKRGTHV